MANVQDIAHALRVVDTARLHVAVLDGEMVGASATLPLEIPSQVIPVGGITRVGVLPTARGRGVLRKLILGQFDECLERGEPIAILWASEGRSELKCGGPRRRPYSRRKPASSNTPFCWSRERASARLPRYVRLVGQILTLGSAGLAMAPCRAESCTE